MSDASTAKAARPWKNSLAFSLDVPAISMPTAERPVKAGPYTDGESRQKSDDHAATGSSGKSAGAWR